MQLIQKLRKIKRDRWHEFTIYPPQGIAIYLRCEALNGDDVKFLKIGCFNACLFNPGQVLNKLPAERKWRFLWKDASEVEE